MTTLSQFARKSPELSAPHQTEPVPMFEFTLQGRQVNSPSFRAFAYFRHLALIREVFRDGVIKLNRVGILVVFRHEHLKKGKLRRLQFSECSFLAVVNVAAARLAVHGLFAHQHSPSLPSWTHGKARSKWPRNAAGKARSQDRGYLLAAFFFSNRQISGLPCLANKSLNASAARLFTVVFCSIAIILSWLRTCIGKRTVMGTVSFSLG